MKPFFPQCGRPLKAVSRFLKHCLSDCPKSLKCGTLFASALLNLLLLSALLSGCATTKKGITEEQKVYSVATNVVAKVQAITPYLPAPIGTPVELALGAVSALLAGWNVHQQRTLKSLKSGAAIRQITQQDPPANPTPPPQGAAAKGAPSGV
jgi:hypothetical protein